MQLTEQHIIKSNEWRDWCVKAKELYNQSGIYQITNIITNDFYIGSAVKLSKRKTNHFSRLRNRIHGNSHLQNSYNKYGESSFIFTVIAVCPKEYLIKLEQWFLDNCKPTFNKHPIASSSLGAKHSDETKQKRRLANLGKKHAEESKEKMRRPKTQEHINKMKIVHCIPVKNNKTGEIFKSIKECAKIMGLSTSTMHSIINKTTKKYEMLDFEKVSGATKKNKPI